MHLLRGFWCKSKGPYVDVRFTHHGLPISIGVEATEDHIRGPIVEPGESMHTKSFQIEDLNDGSSWIVKEIDLHPQSPFIILIHLDNVGITGRREPSRVSLVLREETTRGVPALEPVLASVGDPDGRVPCDVDCPGERGVGSRTAAE
jgi:hypothetical protein